MNEEFQHSNPMSEELHLENEGTLSVDIYYKDNNLVIVSPIAGTSKENIEIIVQGDVLIIKGRRSAPESIEEQDYLRKECFWGPFSRTIVLPKSVDKNNIKAFYENGILIIKIPKTTEEDLKKISIE
ncbi:MAG: Hsp20/alpha crystallin family protein [Patescibacteria group bacterium]